MIGNDQFVFTTAIDEAALAGSSEVEIALAPGIYQDDVAKAFEVRRPAGCVRHSERPAPRRARSALAKFMGLGGQRRKR